MNHHPMNEVEKLFIRTLKTAKPRRVMDEALVFDGNPQDTTFSMLTWMSSRKLKVYAGTEYMNGIISYHPEVLAAFDEAYSKAKADEPFVNHSKLIVDSLNSIISKPS